VTSSYSSGSTLLGPTVNFYQSFISGSFESTSSVNEIVPCNIPFERWYYDPINCPTGDCLPPILTSVSPRNCANAFDYRYFVFFNSGSTNALYSTIEYSTSPDFSFNTSSLIVTNSLNTYTSSININNLPLLPIKTNPVYFRAFNSCSLGGTSSYSSVLSASCQLAPPPPTPSFTVRLKNSMLGSNNELYYTNNGIEYVLFGGTTVNLTIPTLSSLSIPFRTLQLDGFVRTLIVSGSSPTFNGQVTTQLIDDTPTYFGDIVNQSINNYTDNLYYNSSGTPDAAVVVDRTLWNGTGLLEIDFTSFVPSDSANPWYYINQDIDEFGIGGLGS
jgi:hypothetical protein